MWKGCSLSPPPPVLSEEGKGDKVFIGSPQLPTGKTEKQASRDRRRLKQSGSFHSRLQALSGPMMDYCHLAAWGLMIQRSEGRIPEGKVTDLGHSIRLVAIWWQTHFTVLPSLPPSILPADRNAFCCCYTDREASFKSEKGWPAPLPAFFMWMNIFSSLEVNPLHSPRPPHLWYGIRLWPRHR